MPMNPSSPQRRLNSGEWRLSPGPRPAAKVPASTSRARNARTRARRGSVDSGSGEYSKRMLWVTTASSVHDGVQGERRAIVTKAAGRSKRGVRNIMEPDRIPVSRSPRHPLVGVERWRSAFSTSRTRQSRVPPKIRELVRDLERAGFANRGGKGSHRNFAHPRVPKPITVSGRLGDDARQYQIRAVRRAIEESQR